MSSNTPPSRGTPPFEEIEHTADWAMRVRGATLADLFVHAAQAMYSLVAPPDGELRDPTSLPVTERRRVDVDGVSIEGLLVKWLNELLYLTEMEHVAFSRYEVEALEPPGDPTREAWGRFAA